jgi:hypothetical protein
VPSPTPTRDQNVYFVGAGLSVALGLPNTAMLLNGVIELSKTSPRWKRVGLEQRLDRAFRFFYPDAVTPATVALRTYLLAPEIVVGPSASIKRMSPANGCFSDRGGC